MFRVVFDTNIYIQIVVNKYGPAGRCFDLVLNEDIRLYVSKNIINELKSVIKRPAFESLLPDLTDRDIEAFVAGLEEVAEVLKVPKGSIEIVRDPNDDMLIEAAVYCDADFIITWDRDLLDLMTGIDDVSKEFKQKFRKLKIVHPQEFLRLVSEKDLVIEP